MRSGKNRNVFGRSSSQKYSKFHKGDCYGALHIEKKTHETSGDDGNE